MRTRAAAVVSAFSVVAAVAVAACSPKGPFEGEIVLKTTSATGASTMQIRVKGDHLRFDTQAPDGKAAHGLFDPKTSKVTMVVDEQKAVLDLDFSGKSGQGNVDPGLATATKEKEDQVLGLPCTEWRVADPSGKSTRVCIAEGLVYFDPGSLRPGNPGATSTLAKEFRDKRSFPLRSVEYDKDGKELSRTEAVKIERGKVDPALFEIPKDYTRLTPPPAP